ncbi:BREX-1 system phosphatase PglZ type A [Psychrobacter sp. DAB_AL32B]|uniref:BREX-1 system phosphatase PglZ type A n=1 Tax=Psychrobacter sp. DAB_AL32B TaxID=1028414 RepID=UPI0020C22C71|nr:BREX-1 system phosphatase PglZ type A [Psychrobacter sp. DAB_AL32B]
MMQISELAQGLTSKFEQSRIVFWYDPDQSFTEDLEQLNAPLNTATSSHTNNNASDISELVIINMANESVLAVKKRIEIDEPKGRFILYFPHTEPEPERDWLLDIRLYSEQFFADHSSMLLNELGITKMALRTHIHKRQAFFANKQRFAGLKRWVVANEDEQSLDLKMIAVTVKADSIALSDILLSLLKEYAVSLEDEAKATPLWSQLAKFDLQASLWACLDDSYGYVSEQPSFADFVLKLFCTDFWSQIEGVERDWLSNNVLKNAAGRATALAFMVSWRDIRSYAGFYKVIASVLSHQLDIANHSSQYRPIELIECETFEAVEQNIIIGLVDSLLNSSQALDRVQFNTIVSRRLASYWSLSKSKYNRLYEALRNAETLIYLRKKYIDGFHFDNAKMMYDAYATDIFRFDQAYRLFNEYVHTSLSSGSDILRQLDDEVESLYTNWYLYELGLAWDRHLGDENLLDEWKIADIPNQYDFYKNNVQFPLNTTQLKRVFVIVSDALRYEVASELESVINHENKRFKSTISTQLGVLPSYTQLGMAALLPHESLSYQPARSKAVYVDGVSSAGLPKRNEILQKVGGMAVSATDLINWSNQEGRDKIRDASVVYIYHDTIDAIGDTKSTEEKTFEACRSAIDELKNLVGRIINRLNGSYVVITADHGFLFQQKELVADNKTKLMTQPSGVMEAKKRYVIGEQLPSDDAYWKGAISNTANGLVDCSCQTEFLIPKASQRFHFVSGAKFVHGGAMLQEICVPVIHVRELDKEQAAKLEKQPVGIFVVTQPIKLVNNIDKVTFIQTDIVGEKFSSHKINIFILDNEGNEVSSRETINFDSSSKTMDERTREVRLKLIGSKFDRNAQYKLVLENAETKTNYSKYDVTIDLAHRDDFF